MNYQFDNLSRRYEADLADGTKWSYGYDSRSEVTSGKRKLASGLFAGGEQFEYGFDDIGNRTVARWGGDAAGANLHEALYSPANALNQLTSRAVPGFVPVVGDAPDALTLRGVGAGQEFSIQRQEGGRFFGEASVDNSLSAVFARITVTGQESHTIEDKQTGYRFVPKNPENFSYDDDGNLIADGRFTYTWDAENRLTSVTSATSAGPQQLIKFDYDSAGRRIRKRVWSNTSGNNNPDTDIQFIFNGWNLFAILDSQSSTLRNSFYWGLDLSGTEQGAGGVGGLLAMTVHIGSSAGTYYYTYDGNGNVQSLLNAGNSTVAAQYEYGPFGEVIRSTGPACGINPFRFSTKWQDHETDLLYYGYRYYSASTGRWLGRDPLGEAVGPNPQAAFLNSPLTIFDPDGEAPYHFDPLNPATWIYPEEGIWSGPAGNSVMTAPKGSALFEALGGKAMRWVNGTPDLADFAISITVDGVKLPKVVKVPYTGDPQGDREKAIAKLAKRTGLKICQIKRALKVHGVRLHHFYGGAIQVVPQSVHGARILPHSGVASALRAGTVRAGGIVVRGATLGLRAVAIVAFIDDPVGSFVGGTSTAQAATLDSLARWGLETVDNRDGKEEATVKDAIAALNNYGALIGYEGPRLKLGALDDFASLKFYIEWNLSTPGASSCCDRNAPSSTQQ